MIILFFLLSILMVIEASTSLSRLTGYLLKTPESGLILQSSLSLISRMVMFLFMPFLGYLSDKNKLLNDETSIFIGSLFIPIGLFFLYAFNIKIIHIYSILIKRVNQHGSFFHGLSFFSKKDKNHNFSIRKIKKLNKFYYLVLFSYVPYYLAWPIVILLLDTYHEQRGMILGMSSIFNGINTILLTMFIDPKLIKFGKYTNLLPSIYLKLIKIIIFASCIAILFVFISYIILFS